MDGYRGAVSFACVMLLAVRPSAAQEQSSAASLSGDVWNQMRRSAVVYLQVVCPNHGIARSGGGSAFMLGSRYVVTAMHVVYDCPEGGKQTGGEPAGIRFGFGDNNVMMQPLVNFGDLNTWHPQNGADLAIIDIGASTVRRPSLCLGWAPRVKEGDNVSIYGFGLTDPGRSRYGSIDVLDTTRGLIKLKIDSAPGYSGAPVVNSFGYVIAVHVDGGNGTSYAVPLDRYDSEFDQLGIHAQKQAISQREPNEQYRACEPAQRRVIGYRNRVLSQGDSGMDGWRLRSDPVLQFQNGRTRWRQSRS